MTNANDFIAGQEILPGYTLTRPLGGGMAGDVWVARAAGGTDVAVKVVRSLSVLGGRKELKALRTIRNIRHPNLCPLHGFWTIDLSGRILAEGETEAIQLEDSVSPQTLTAKLTQSARGTMELGSFSGATVPDPEGDTPTPTAEKLIVVMGLGDKTLFDRLQEVRLAAGIPADTTDVAYGLEAVEAIRYLRAAAAAIDLLNQEHNIYHCDIKPQNILLVGGEAQVCDFGLANKFEGEAKTTRTVFASPVYAAPEVLQGKTYSKTVDQYSLSITYFELRTGILPFDITTDAGITLAKCTGKLDLEKVSSAERKVLRRAMNLDPDKRFDSCGDMVRALAIASGVDRKAGITPLRLAIAAAMLSLLIGGSWFGWKYGFPESYRRYFPDSDANSIYSVAAGGFETVEALPDTGSYLNQQGVLRNSLETLIGASENTGLTESQRQDLEIWRTKTAARLIAKIEEVLENRQLDALSMETLRGDLDYLTENSTELATGVGPYKLAKAQLQYNLMQDGDNFGRSQAEAERLLNSNQLTEPDRDSLVILVALNSIPDVDSIDYVRKFGAADQIWNQTDHTKLPTWWIEKWTALRGENLSKLNEALQRDGRAELQETIRDYWPDISAIAKLDRLRDLMLRKDWSGFTVGLKDLDNERSNTAEYLEKKDIFVRFAQGLNDPQGLPREDLLALTDQVLAKGNLDAYFQTPMEGWIEEYSQRRFNLDPAPSYEAAKSYLIDIGDTIAKISAPTDHIWKILGSGYLTSVIRSEPSRERAAEALMLVERHPSDTTGKTLRDIIKLEDAVIFGSGNAGPIRLDAESIEKIKQQLPTDFSGYLNGLLLMNDRELNEAVTIWSAIDPIPVDLGAIRCRYVADKMLDLAIEESGIDDSNVLAHRYQQNPNGSKYINDAKRWLEPFGQRSEIEDVSDRLKVHEMLLARARGENVVLPDQFVTMCKNVLDGNTGIEPRAEYGQLYRAVFDSQLEYYHSQGASDEQRRAAVYVLAAASGAMGLQAEFLSSPEVLAAEIINPAMSIAIMYADDDKLTPVVSIFLAQYLRLGETLRRIGDLGRSGEYLKNLEFCEAWFGLRTDREAAGEYFLRAGDLLQEQISRKHLIWNKETLERLSEYVDGIERSPTMARNAAVQKGLLHSYAARIETDPLKRYKSLKIAELELTEAIAEMAEPETGIDAQINFNGFSRHANNLVALAFEESKPELKIPHLEKAKASAKKAIEIAERYNRETTSIRNTNLAYSVLGNSCEDLAYYCESEPWKHYSEAEQAFRIASEKSAPFNLIPDIALARCIIRRLQSATGRDVNKEERKKLMTELEAKLSAGFAKTIDLSPEDEIEGLVIYALVLQNLGKHDESFSRLDAARKVCLKLDLNSGLDMRAIDNAVDAFAAGASTRIGRLRNEGNTKEAKAIYLDIVELVESRQRCGIEFAKTSFWTFTETYCLLLLDNNDFNRFREQLRLIPPQRYGDIVTKPKEVLDSIGSLAGMVAFHGSAVKYGDKPAIAQQDAIALLDAFIRQIEKQLESTSQSEESKLLLRLIKAEYRAISFADSDKLNSIKEMLAVLPEEKMEDSRAVRESRRFLARQYSQLFSEQPPVQLPILAKWDRDQLLGFLEQLTYIRNSLEKAEYQLLAGFIERVLRNNVGPGGK